jgi:predicted RNase H-like nuclease (RuvC/YqgF family)
MSLNLVRQNSQSPFRLQRSMVDQGGEGGAYESGGFTGESQYNDGGAAAAISSFGNTIAAGLGSITPGDKNKMNEKKATRLENRSQKTELKKKQATAAGNTSKADRMEKRNKRVETRLSETNKEIEDYKKSKNPTLESDIKPVTAKKETTNTETKKDVSSNSSKKPLSSKQVEQLKSAFTNTGTKLKEITDFNSPIDQKRNKKLPVTKMKRY